MCMRYYLAVYVVQVPFLYFKLCWGFFLESIDFADSICKVILLFCPHFFYLKDLQAICLLNKMSLNSLKADSAPFKKQTNKTLSLCLSLITCLDFKIWLCNIYQCITPTVVSSFLFWYQTQLCSSCFSPMQVLTLLKLYDIMLTLLQLWFYRNLCPSVLEENNFLRKVLHVIFTKKHFLYPKFAFDVTW